MSFWDGMQMIMEESQAPIFLWTRFLNQILVYEMRKFID